jgi:hypothetical protein
MKNELKPWLDQQVPPELRRLLMVARTQEPTLDDVQRVIAQVAMAGVSNSSSASIEPSAGGATGSAIVGMKWALLGGGLAAGIAVGVAGVDGQRFNTHSGASSGIGSSALESLATLPAVESNGTEPTVPRPSEVAPTAAASQEIAPGHPRPRKARTSADLAFSGGTSTLGAESGQSTHGSSRAAAVTHAAPFAAPMESQSAYIDRARDALRRGRPGETLRILDQYELTFQACTFVPEALQLRMRAFATLGKGASAKQVGTTLAHRYPSTPQGKEALEFLGR